VSHSNRTGQIITATGRVPGRKGMETRLRLLEEVERRCLVVHHSSISVGDIAKATGTSPATFYHYFPDIAAAAAEVATNHLAEFESVLDCARSVVVNRGDYRSCRELVEAYFSFWEDRPGLLEAIVVASRDEDARFFRVLLRGLVSLTNTLAVAVPAGHASGVAGSLVMMLSQAAARRDGFERDGVDLESLIDSQARILSASLGPGHPTD
jgi:AcrR family transcriptional regulator